jgi:hypothetical protein
MGLNRCEMTWSWRGLFGSRYDIVGQLGITLGHSAWRAAVWLDNRDDAFFATIAMSLELGSAIWWHCLESSSCGSYATVGGAF